MPLQSRIAFLGGGVMAQAILRSLREAGLPAGRAVGFDPVPASLAALAALGAETAESNRAACAGADVLLLAVKPFVLPEVLAEIAPLATASQLVISIAAGVRTAALEAALPLSPVVRVMPNTPIQVGAGAAALCRGSRATAEHAALARRLFEAGGLCEEVTEAQLDAVTGLSGSGPAFACVLIEALADGGVRMGLPRAVALRLAAQTLLGTAKLVLETGEHPAVWKDRVATPGGTTIAGLAALEEAGVRAGLMQAVEAAARRATELGS
jgi:pyrroline-5-carboxylate reductase